MNLYPAAWAALIGAGLTLEAAALLREGGPYTLSSNVWRVLRLIDRRHRVAGYIARGMVLAGLTLLGVHLAFEWPQ